LSEGEIKNFGKPIDLLLDETTVLYELTKKLSKQEKQTLFTIINQNKLNKSLEASHVSKIQMENIIVDKDSSSVETNLSNSYVNQGQTIAEDE
jgi:hypothetical protein